MQYIPLIALVVTVVLGGIGYYYFRAGRRRTQLRYDVAVRPVFPTRSGAKITIDDKPVETPYEVRLWFQPAGIKDITSNAFDPSVELVLPLGAPLVTNPTAGDNALKVIGEPGDEQIVVPPQMLKCGELVYASMIVDGRPRVSGPRLQGALADVDVSKFNFAEMGNQTLASRMIRSEILPLASVGAAAIGVVAATFLISDQQTEAQSAEEALRQALQSMQSESRPSGPGELGLGVGQTRDAQQQLQEMIRQAVADALAGQGMGAAPPPSSPPASESRVPTAPSNSPLPSRP